MDRKTEFSVVLAAREGQHMYANAKEAMEAHDVLECEDEIRRNDQKDFCLELGQILNETLLEDPMKDAVRGPPTPTTPSDVSPMRSEKSFEVRGPPTPTTPSDVSPMRSEKSFEDIEDIFSTNAMSPTRSRKSFEDIDDIFAIEETVKVTPTCTQLSDLATVQEWLTQLNDLAIDIHAELEEVHESPKATADETKRILLHMVGDLIEAYRNQACQAQVQILQDPGSSSFERRQNAPLLILKGRAELCFEVQNNILPKYGFRGLETGVCAWPLVEQEKMSTIDVLLGSDPSATQAELRDLVKVQGC